MRWVLLVSIFLSGCYRPDFNDKRCRDDTGCPPSWACVQERCRELVSGEVPVLPEVAIPGGAFLLGSELLTGINDYSRPAHMVQVAPFSLDEREVTVRAYRACVEARVCDPPGTAPGCNYGKADRDAHPINCVNWDQARVFCRWVGRRLPTEEEWEFGARGARGQSYPWGEISPMAASPPICWKRTMAEGSCPSGDFAKTLHGLHDMGGNVWEWTASRFCSYADRSACSEPPAYVVRGAGWSDTDPKIVYAWVRLFNEPLTQDINRGFRCAR